MTAVFPHKFQSILRRRALRRFALAAALGALAASCAPPPPPPPAGTLDYTPRPFDFGNVVVGDNKTMAMTLTNSAGQGNVSIGLVNLERADRRHFSVTPRRGPVNLNPGQTSTVTFTCNPKAVGRQTANYAPLIVTGNAPNFPATISCTGVYRLTEGTSISVATPGVVGADPINFGRVVVGTNPSPTRSLTVTNRTNQQITVTVGWVYTDATLTITTPASVNIPANGSATVTLQYAPTQVGRNANLLRITKAAGDRFTIAVFGEGIRAGGGGGGQGGGD